MSCLALSSFTSSEWRSLNFKSHTRVKALFSQFGFSPAEISFPSRLVGLHLFPFFLSLFLSIKMQVDCSQMFAFSLEEVFHAAAVYDLSWSRTVGFDLDNLELFSCVADTISNQRHIFRAAALKQGRSLKMAMTEELCRKIGCLRLCLDQWYSFGGGLTLIFPGS